MIAGKLYRCTDSITFLRKQFTSFDNSDVTILKNEIFMLISIKTIMLYGQNHKDIKIQYKSEIMERAIQNSWEKEWFEEV